MSRKIWVNKEVRVNTDVDIDVQVTISDREIVEALKHSDELDDILECCGFISVHSLGFETTTILDSIKLELIGDILKKATLDQLEQFRKTL